MMSQISMPSIFLGVTPAPVRRYLGTILASAAPKFDRIILPCAGRFSGTMVALKAGFRPEQVYCSDISLFTGLIGLLAAGKDPRELEARVNLPDVLELETFANEATDPVDHAAGVLVAFKLATTKGDTAYVKMFTSDLAGEWRRHVGVLKVRLLKLVESLKGINYRPADLFDEVQDAAADPRALVYLAPPDVSGGYIKMFDTAGKVTFKQPDIQNFDPKGGFDRLAEITKDAQALVLTLKPADDRKPDVHPEAVFASLTGTRLHLLLANRRADALALAKVRSAVQPSKATSPRYPVWGSSKDRITPTSKLSITKAKADVGLYYRDLFAHRLGSTNAEAHFLVWLDGKVFATVGMNLAFARSGRPYSPEDPRLMAWQQYAMSTSHRGYKFLNKLLNMAITCEEFLGVLKKSTRFPMGDPAGVRTACITKSPEAKHLRGIMKRLASERRPDGMYHLTYATDWRKGSLSDQVTTWLTKYGDAAETTEAEGAEA